MAYPKIILLFSGKRKSGKDYICEKIQSLLGEDGIIIRISGPLKRLYAQNHDLNFQELLSDGPYKEIYRRDMIVWSDKVRETEPGYFCQAACQEASEKPVWIVSDVRRKTDIEWFKCEYGNKVKTIRVEVEPQVRENRGWVFTKGIDDVASECNLDDLNDWDLRVQNNTKSELQSGLDLVISVIKSVLE